MICHLKENQILKTISYRLFSENVWLIDWYKYINQSESQTANWQYVK